MHLQPYTWPKTAQTLLVIRLSLHKYWTFLHIFLKVLATAFRRLILFAGQILYIFFRPESRWSVYFPYITLLQTLYVTLRNTMVTNQFICIRFCVIFISPPMLFVSLCIIFHFCIPLVVQTTVIACWSPKIVCYSSLQNIPHYNKHSSNQNFAYMWQKEQLWSQTEVLLAWSHTLR